MPNYRRPHVTGGTVFFTLCLAERGGDLLVQEVSRLRQAVAEVKAARPFAIRAWVVLPDHLHAIWELPEGDGDYSGRWKDIKGGFTKSLGRTGQRTASKIAKGEAGIWQRRFWDHHIRDEGDLAAHLHYCWSNPVKHGLVCKPADWPYSSIHREIRRGVLEAGWVGIPGDGAYGE